jgi:N-acetylgalactosamine-6-sulfatase
VKHLHILLSAAIVTSALANSRLPNIVLILADDLGYGDLGCYGCTDIRTPTIDRLANQGVRFTQFYANAPECSPTRTALMTGQYPQRAGGLECAIGFGNVGRYDHAIRLRADRQLGLPVKKSVLAGILKQAGYSTAVIGKWHLGYEPHFLPLKHGFDYAFGPLGGGVDYFHHCEPHGLHTLYGNDAPIKRDGYMTDLITREAVAFIKRQNIGPFFLYVPYTAPHTPYQGPADKKDGHITEKDWNKGSRKIYAKMVECMDEGVGMILKALKEKGVDQDTLVIFASDNGANRTGCNAPFSGYKSGLFEGGIRVPCVIRWPGRLPEGVTTDLVGLTMDLTASMARIAGGKELKGHKFDGIDIIGQLEEKRPPKDRTVFWRARRGERTWRAVRDGNMKYLSRQEGKATEEYLFNLSDDPGEKTNLLNANSKQAHRLKALLAKWEAEVRPQR